MSPTSELTIGSSADARVLTRPFVLLKAGIYRVRLEPDALPVGEGRRAEINDLLDRYVGDCGCAAGTALAAATLLLWAGLFLLGPIGPLSLWDILLFIASVVAAAGLGKLGGRL